MSLSQTCVENFHETEDDAEISVFLSVNPHSCELPEAELEEHAANGETFQVRYLFNDGSVMRLSVEYGAIMNCEVILQRRIHPEAQEELQYTANRGYSAAARSQKNRVRFTERAS